MADKDESKTTKPVEEPKVEEPKVEEPKVEEPKVEEPASSPVSPMSDTPTSAGTDKYGRQLYNVKCATCGKETQVPFKPVDGRPVYCRDCYMQQRKGVMNRGMNRGPRR